MPNVPRARCAGVLLHISSLPNEYGLGDFGAAKSFIDYLASSGMSVWQVLPLGPTHKDLSPYLCTSSLAGNPMFIDLNQLCELGWLSDNLSANQYRDVVDYRIACLKESFNSFKNDVQGQWHQDYQAFADVHDSWLNDFALFTAQWRTNDGVAWMHWPQPLRDREPWALQKIQQQLANDIEQVKFEQFVFYQQWLEIKRYANKKGILIFGDMPLYLAHNSVEVWANREFFKVDSQGQTQVVAGVPPDYFSSTGQIWGNPVYDWGSLQADGFKWWINRLKTQLELYDLLRIDHFRGLQAFWEIPHDAQTAACGNWQVCPGFELLQVLEQTLGSLPLVAEDLGFITHEVQELRDRFALPGMKVMQFAFDGNADNPYLRRNHVENCVAYTGTHDNETTLAWYQGLSPETRNVVDRELAEYVESNQNMPWSLIDYTLGSPAYLVMLPMQDILALGPGNRFNTPGTVNDNWLWQFRWEQVPKELADKLYVELRKCRRLTR